MLTLLLTSMLITANPDQPTEVYGSAASPTGGQNTITVQQPENTQNPFGYIAPETSTPAAPQLAQAQPVPQTHSTAPQNTPSVKQLANQLATVNPKDMNPLDYKDKIENTIYQSGDRLIVIQSIPMKYIKEATEPNIQPSINDFPQF